MLSTTSGTLGVSYSSAHFLQILIMIMTLLCDINDDKIKSENKTSLLNAAPSK